MSLLSVRDVSAFDDGKTTVKHISFEQGFKEKIAIAGETGSGKTTLLKMIAGLIQPASGNIFLHGERVKGPDEQLIAGHTKIGFLSQHFELRNNYRVEELLDMANLVSQEEANTIYAICDIKHLLTRWTDELSGGEKQRISLAKLLIGKPDILLLDEPYSNLDLLHKRQMKQAIEALGEKMNISFILVSHDAADILSWADTVFFMRDGSIVQSGTAFDLYNKPANEYAAALLGAYNLLRADSAVLPVQYRHSSGHLFFRPENIKITPPKDGMIVGHVEKVLYWGNYYTVDIKLGDELITVQTPQQQWDKGEQAGLQFLTEPYWMNDTENKKTGI